MISQKLCGDAISPQPAPAPVLGKLLAAALGNYLKLKNDLLSRERQKPKMEVIMHKSSEFDDAVAQESAAGRHAPQRSESPRYLAPCMSLNMSSAVRAVCFGQLATLA